MKHRLCEFLFVSFIGFVAIIVYAIIGLIQTWHKRPNSIRLGWLVEVSSESRERTDA